MTQAAMSQDSFRNTRTVLVSLIAACVIVGIGMSFWIGKLFSDPLRKAVGLLREVAEGDLTGRLDLRTTDEVGEMAKALNEAMERMRNTLQDVSRASEGVNTASRELTSSSELIADGAQQQAASLEETAASLEQITATVRQSADNAREASVLASSSRESAEQGGHIVSDAVTAMGEINTASKKISDIISTVDEIAFQTNLLAVNAAVEAARAGEQGRGFAVVASEVRNLALRSAASAKEIKALIGDTLHKVNKGTALVNRSGETLQSIIQSVKRVSEIVGDIAIASKEQSTGIEQVNQAMGQMDGVTQTNSAQTKDLADTAGSLSGQSSALMALVNKFKIEKTAARQPEQSPDLARWADDESQYAMTLSGARPSGAAISAARAGQMS
jgi:methyl-accepting chemotaxis protein